MEEGPPHHLALENGVLTRWAHQGGAAEPELRFIRNVGGIAGVLEPEPPFTAAVVRGTWSWEAGDPLPVPTARLPPGPPTAGA